MKASELIRNNFIENIFRNQKGVSLIMLVIAIVMMLIIVTFAVFNSKNTTPEAKVAASLSSLASIKDACENALGLIELNPEEYDEYYFFGNNIHHKRNSTGSVLSDSEKQEYAKECGLGESYTFNDDTYVIKPAETEEEKRILKNLEIKNISDTYIVDLLNKEYYIVGGVEHADGAKAYEYKDILRTYEMLVGK